MSRLRTARQPPDGKPTEHGWHTGRGASQVTEWQVALTEAGRPRPLVDREYVAPVLADSGPLEPSLAGWGVPMLMPMEPGISSLTLPVASGSTPLLHPLSPFPC